MALVEIQWRPSPRELRKFGLAILLGMGVIGTGFWFGWLLPEQRNLAQVLWMVGTVVGSVGLTGTKAALPLYWAWMAVAFVMGNIISRLILAVVFYGLITPMGLCFRLRGRDRLQLEKRRDVPTYWTEMKSSDDPASYERQF